MRKRTARRGDDVLSRLGRAASPRPKARGFDPDAAAGPGSGLFGLRTKAEDARVVVLPVPFEATTSYGGGTSLGPAAMLAASHQVDLLDADFGRTYEAGIATWPAPPDVLALSRSARKKAEPVIRAGGVVPGDTRLERAAEEVNEASEHVNEWVSRQAATWLDRGKLVGVIGGDHSVPFGLIAELAERHPGLGVLHVDAHCDLRQAYEGFTWSHASIMFQVVSELGDVARLVQVGIRDFGEQELRVIGASRGRIRTFFETDVRRRTFAGTTWDEICREVVAALPPKVHVSFDIDGLSPDHCPHTGTPVPGGWSFAEAVHLLRVLAASRQVVGFDLCEVSPGPAGDEWDANVGARMLYKLIGCALSSRPSAARRVKRR